MDQLWDPFTPTTSVSWHTHPGTNSIINGDDPTVRLNGSDCWYYSFHYSLLLNADINNLRVFPAESSYAAILGRLSQR